MERTRTRLSTTVHRIIRAIVLLDFALLIVDSYSLHSPRSFIFYWVTASTLLVVGLLLGQLAQRVYAKDKLDRGLLIDFSLVAVWIITLFVGALRSGAGASG
jgi:hypothetical protein